MSTTGSRTTASGVQAAWVRSSFSGPQGNCVEVAMLPGGQVAVRNSRDPNGPALIFTGPEWDAFLNGVRGGEFGKPA